MSVIQSAREFLVNITHLTVGEAMFYGSKRGSTHSGEQLNATFNLLFTGIMDWDFELL